MSHLCTEPFDALSVFGFLEAFCMGAVIVGNTKCLIFSEEFDDKLPWRQFSKGMREATILPYLTDWNKGLYESSLVTRTYVITRQSRPNELDVIVKPVFEPTVTLRGVEFLRGAFVGSVAKDAFLGASKIFQNAWNGWQLWATDALVLQQSDVPAPELTHLKSADGFRKDAPRRVAHVPSNPLYNLRESESEAEPAPAKKEKVKTRGLLQEEDREEEPENQLPVKIPEDLRIVLTELNDIRPPLKEGGFNYLLNKAIAYRRKMGSTVVCEQVDNAFRIRVTREGKEITFPYEPTHKQHGQNSTEFSGPKLNNALRVVQNLYLIDVPTEVQDELDRLGLIRRIKGATGFLRYVLTNR